MAADLLLRVRRPAAEAARHQGARGVGRESSRVFVDGRSRDGFAIVTAGGPNLGTAAAAELVRCGASVGDHGPRGEILAGAAADIGERCDDGAGTIVNVTVPTAARRRVA